MPSVYNIWNQKSQSVAALRRDEVIANAIALVKEDADKDNGPVIHASSFNLGWIAHEVHETSQWAETILTDMQLELPLEDM